MRFPTLKELPPPLFDKRGWPWTVGDEERPSAIAEHDKYSAKAEGRVWPRISIVTPSYNQGQFIEETIRSVLLQGYPNLEYIIIDGGSKDNSVEIIKKYEKWISYSISEKDEGQSHAINKGFSKATGKIFAWICSDDVYYPGVLHKIAVYWTGHPSCQFLTGDGEIVDSTGEKSEYYIKAKPYSFRELLRYHKGIFLPQASVFFSKEAFLATGGLNMSFQNAIDVDLFLRMRKLYPLHYLPATLSKWRHHENAKTWRDNIFSVKEARDLIISHLDKVNIFEYFYIRTGIDRYYASTICQNALLEYLRKNPRQAVALLKKAIYVYPAILLSLIGLKMVLRLTLPRYFKKRLFKIIKN